RTFFLHLASAATGAAWRFDGLTAAMAGRAGAHHAEHALLRADLAGALAGGAGFQRRVAFGARALARLARLRARHDDLALIAAESLFERDLDIVAKIGAATGAVARSACAARKHFFEAAAEDLVEEVGKIRRAAMEAAAAGAAALERGLAEAIASRALSRTGNHRIGFAQRL